jgi:ABC-type phosphate/phosphonate transport system permease subunit
VALHVDDTAEKVKHNNDLKKRRILTWLGYVALIAFVIWFVTGLDMDYFSHLDVDTPILPDFYLIS